MPGSPFAPSPMLPTQLESHYRAHHGWLAHWLQRRLGNAAEAADLMQDTFTRLLAGPTGSRKRRPCARRRLTWRQSPSIC